MKWWPLQTTQPNDRWQRNCEITALRQQGMKMGDLAQRYGLTRERIRQIVLKTQRKQRRRTAEHYWGA